jgi:hypothetical protein
MISALLKLTGTRKEERYDVRLSSPRFLSLLPNPNICLYSTYESAKQAAQLLAVDWWSSGANSPPILQKPLTLS